MTKQEECRKPVVITKDFPIALKYAEVGKDEKCPTPVIGDVKAALKREVKARCAEGECDQGDCVPESPNVFSILRQVAWFSTVEDDRKLCWVVIVAEVDTKCVCKQ